MRVLFLTMTLAIVGIFPINAQEIPVRIETELVTLNVAVRNERGKSVPGLTQEQFEIFDNEVSQKIEHFSHASAGVTFAIVYDMHPTTTEQTNAVLNGMRNFTKGLPGIDDFFLMVFNERGSLTFDFVPDVDQLERHLAKPDKREPRSLYDALYQVAGKLRGARNLKRVLLVVTDSADHNSRHSFNDLRGELRTFDVQVYAITPDQRMGGDYRYEDLTIAEPASDASPSERAALNSITLHSGGTAFPSSLKNQGNVERVLQRVSDEMRSLYSISFHPTTPPDGKWHRLRIRLRKTSDKGFVFTYRPGYQAGSQKRDD